MKKFNKNTKKGFTLLEMMLAIAIILLISGLFLGLILAVHESFYRVYNDDDSTDYAALYSQALENQILYDIQNNVSRSYYITQSETDGYLLTTSSGDVFGFGDIFNFNKNKDDQVKWRIYLEAEYEPSSHVLNYTIYVVDNYFHPEQNKLVQQYSSSLWIPYHDEFQSSSSMPNVSVQPYGSPVSVHSFDMTRTISISPSQIVFTAS